MITDLDLENVKGFIYLTFDSKISEDIRSNTSRMNVDSPYSSSEYMNAYGYPRYGSVVKPIRINTKTLDKFAYCNNRKTRRYAQGFCPFVESKFCENYPTKKLKG